MLTGTLHTLKVGSREIDELQLIADELKQRLSPITTPARWNADPEDVKRSVMQLVLTLVDFIRQVMERQALRRMEEGSLSPDEIERIGVALMKLEETVNDLARQAGLDPKDLNLDLGPLGRLT
jgi:tetrahydromethanopterin S-methyltransferase subunit B